jgi:hypothetical protein
VDSNPRSRSRYSSSRDRLVSATRFPFAKTEITLSRTRDQGFESCSLQRRVKCEPDFRGLSPEKFSAGNFQLHGMTRLCMPSMISTPSSRRSKNTSKYQVTFPRYQILAQRRHLRVEGGKQQSLVAVQLRHRLEAQPLSLQFAVIGLFERRDTD